MNFTDWELVKSSSILQLRNLACGTIEADISDALWSQIGINVPPEHISLAPHKTPFATMILSRPVLADYLNRLFLEGVKINGQTPQVFPSTFGARSR